MAEYFHGSIYIPVEVSNDFNGTSIMYCITQSKKGNLNNSSWQQTFTKIRSFLVVLVLLLYLFSPRKMTTCTFVTNRLS